MLLDPGVKPDDNLLNAAYEELELAEYAGEMPSIELELDRILKKMDRDNLVQELKLHNL